MGVKRENRRKLRSLIGREKSKKKRANQDDMEISGSESEEEIIKHKPKIFKETIEPCKSGLIGLDPKYWKELSDKKKKIHPGL